MQDTPPDPLLEQLEDQVAAALELPDKARAVAFEKIRETHPEHTELLVRAERAAARLEPELRTLASVSSAVRAESLAQAPAQIGDYKILDVLGVGGMGTVFLAQQERPVRRRVALKLIHGGMAPDALVRFEAERQSLAMMSHPHIAKVFEAGETEDGRPYFSLEYVPGVPITDYCDRHQLDLRERIALFQKVCDGVQHAHQKGVIHRDLKPSNVLVTRHDDLADPKIIDFGLAKALQQRLTERTLYTEQGRILGTPEYMSPEQAELTGLDVDTRTDIYALGVLLYQLLAGVLPIDAADLRRAGYFEMQRRICEDEPLRPSTRVSTVDASGADVARRRRTDLRQLCDALRGDLDWIVMRCLEKAPERRYPSASELAADLQRHLDDEPVLASPPSAAYRLRKLLRRRRGPVAAAAAVLVALVGGLSVAVWQYRIARAHADDATAQAERAAGNLRTAQENEQRARQAEQRAARELRRSTALNLAAASRRALGQDPVDALLLAREAAQLDPNPETLGSVQTVLAEQHLVCTFPEGSPVRGGDFGSQSRRVLTAHADGSLRIWTEQGTEICRADLGGAVLQARFSSDERFALTVVAVGEHHIVARAHDLRGRLVAEVGADGPRLSSADWTADGERLLARFADGGRVAWLDRAGTEVRILRRESRVPVTILVSPEGHAAVCDGAIKLGVWWPGDDEVTDLRVRRLGERFRVRAITLLDGTRPRETCWFARSDVVFDPRGELVATLHADQAARVWSRTGELMAVLDAHRYTLHSVAFSPSGEFLLTSSGDGTARLWTRDGHQLQVIDHGAEIIGAGFFGSDDRILTSNLLSIALWSGTGRKLVELRGTQRGLAVDVVPRAGLVLTGGRRLRLWNLHGVAGSWLRSPHDRPYQITCRMTGEVLATSNDGRVCAWGTDGSLLRVFDSESGAPTYGVAASPDGALVVAGGKGKLFAWDWNSGAKLWERELGRSAITHMSFLADGRRLFVAASPARTAWIVDVVDDTRSVLMDRRTEGAGGGCAWGFVSPDRQLIALLALGGFIRLLDAEGHKLTDFRPGHDLDMWHIAFDRQGRWLGIAGNAVSVWDLAAILAGQTDPEPVHIARHQARAYWMDFSPDGDRLVAALHGSAYVADLDGTERFRVWPRAGEFTGYVPPVAFFSPDGQWLLGGAFDGVRRWPADETMLLQRSERWAARYAETHDLSEYAGLLQNGEKTESRR